MQEVRLVPLGGGVGIVRSLFDAPCEVGKLRDEELLCCLSTTLRNAGSFALRSAGRDEG